MSLFDLQDVCIAIGSIATLDLPMVVDLIGIYGLKGPYRMITTTNWFLQALSVIPRGSWGDVSRRFTMIRWADSRMDTQLNVLSTRRGFREVRLPKSQQGSNRGFPLLRGKTPPPPLSNAAAAVAAAAAARLRRKFVSGQFDEENPFVLISSVLLVQADEGVSFLVVDRIGDSTAIYREEPTLLKGECMADEPLCPFTDEREKIVVKRNYNHFPGGIRVPDRRVMSSRELDGDELSL
ncbi:hypothetical protein F511_38794 [Dorcoceras hygrometricum]|uniref:Uncharacterized protein n=1 Tax=Dorcoceras hygrometricum TaxID=472368 RepID=A0A2Z7BAP6_9LAMI|nr:hypothetical protein F511_38794 [Dorcoceras hygrometricum]